MITGILFVKIIVEMEWAHEYNKINCERWDGKLAVMVRLTDRCDVMAVASVVFTGHKEWHKIT